MSQHAQPRHSTARRVAAISGGTLVLCLAGAAPALAGTADPVPLPDLSPVTHVVGPVLDTLEPVIPVHGIVHQASDQAGTDDPLATPKRSHHHHAHRPAVSPSHVTPPRHVVRAGHAKPAPGVSGAGGFGWRVPLAIDGFPTVPVATAPVVERVSPPTVAATPGTAHRVASAAARAAHDLTDPGTPAGRTLLVVLGTMLVGTLAGGHVKVAQDQLATLG
jgi:hypothetical protein